MAAGKFSFHLFKRNIFIDHQDGQVIQQIGQFSYGVFFFAVFGRDDHLAALFPAFFQDLIQALFK